MGVFLESKSTGQPLSPFHDVPLYADEANGILNFIVEIPRWTNAKIEISKEDSFNPFKQDTKKGKLRYVRNSFPHKGYIWNYGAFPQTWEDPAFAHPDTKANGDNDPLDVVEIGETVGYPGQIRATNEWFRIYKIPYGKPENQFAFSGEAKNRSYATEVVHECHEAWRRLVTGQ